MKVQGRCHCGKISYEAEVDPAKVSMCHCTDCQSLTGTAYRVSVPALRENFVLKSGEPKVYVKTADSGNRRAQAFCADCGSPVYASAVEEAPAAYMLRVGGLAQRAELPPLRQIWCRSSLAWANDTADLPRSDGQ